uniref:Uncharacterized protein n=1 Tax=Anguilla anguilla TaxID=7936 RepID=A0A0E9RMV5_ANGAN
MCKNHRQVWLHSKGIMVPQNIKHKKDFKIKRNIKNHCVHQLHDQGDKDEPA